MTDKLSYPRIKLNFDPSSTAKYKTLSVRVPDDMYEDLKIIARENFSNKSYVFRALAEAGLLIYKYRYPDRQTENKKS